LDSACWELLRRWLRRSQVTKWSFHLLVLRRQHYAMNISMQWERCGCGRYIHMYPNHIFPSALPTTTQRDVDKWKVGHIALLVAFYDRQGIPWDYSVTRSHTGDMYNQTEISLTSKLYHLLSQELMSNTCRMQTIHISSITTSTLPLYD